MNRKPNDPNKGMNTRVFLISVVVATAIIFVGILVFLKAKKTSGEPKVTSPNPAKSQLVPNAQQPYAETWASTFYLA